MSNEERSSAAERLRKLYDTRWVPKGLSQADFGTIYGIGSQSMVAQYLSGHRPLNFEAAAKFAKGLGCTIADISPEMARRLKAEIFPVLGRVSLKAALAFLLAIPPLMAPQHAEARILHNQNTHWLRRLIRRAAITVRLRTKAV